MLAQLPLCWVEKKYFRPTLRIAGLRGQEERKLVGVENLKDQVMPLRSWPEIEFNPSRNQPSAWKKCIKKNVRPATMADAGIVRIQAHTILPAIPHRTADKRCTAPTPTIAPVMV